VSVLVTGGAGYIGSHAVQRLLRDGRRVVVVDNLCRGHRETLDVLAEDAGDRLVFVESDVGDGDRMGAVIRDEGVKEVLHFAALAYVGESVEEPLRYYRNNTAAALALIEACVGGGVEKFIFSSTCATYGAPGCSRIPIAESCPQEPINPYGRSKLAVEHILEDTSRACRRTGRPFAYAALRYFNVAGCDRSGLLGERHVPETHLVPRCLQAALGELERLTVYGTGYPTADGTCVRDYVHVEDLVDAHVTALEAIVPGDCRSYNIGVGRGYSVREVIDSARRVTGVDFEVAEAPPRPGDPPVLFSDPSAIARELGWRAAVTDLDGIVGSAWRWFRRRADRR
jgi:UDP-glucose 4-epimerase